MFKRPTTDENPKITTMCIKFGSFLNKYLVRTKIKLIPISEETKPVPKVVSSPVKVVSELNVISNAEITFLNSSNESSGMCIYSRTADTSPATNQKHAFTGQIPPDTTLPTRAVAPRSRVLRTLRRRVLRTRPRTPARKRHVGRP